MNKKNTQKDLSELQKMNNDFSNALNKLVSVINEDHKGKKTKGNKKSGQ
jgi:hypothetical protein